MSLSLSRGPSYSPSESFDYTPLQIAAKEGKYEEVEFLIDSGDDLNVGPDPPLHLALRKKHNEIALLLLEKGANFELRDSYGDCPIHIACAYGMLDVVHTLCTLGCTLEVTNAKGLYPLHLAAKYGHIHVVRCLCAAGCNIDAKNTDNIRADITALKYGYNDIAELLDRLRVTGQRDAYARQLVPTTKPANRLTLRVLGHCAVGKTAFIKSLGAGLFSSLFKRSSSLQSNKSRPSSPINTHIEMDVTTRQNSLTFEAPMNYHSTKGIHFQNLDVSNVGEITVIEFSGHESYFPVYHNFLYPAPNVLTVILFNLEDTASVQIQQVCFWINFLMARQPADLPSTEYGKIHLIATHVDLTRTPKGHNGEWVSSDAQNTLETVQKIIPHVQNLYPNVLVLDCNVPASQAFKQFKALLSSLKQECNMNSIGTWTGFLDSTITWLTVLRKEYRQFPVLYKEAFYELVRDNVNLLASDNHIEELLQQLHSMGEVFCIGEVVVISLPWLGSELIGVLLSNEFLANVRSTGVYTSEDFQACFNQCDALGTLELLEALQLCIHCEVDGETEYEFPIYNQTETLPGLWDPDDPRYKTTGSIYGGVRLFTPPNTFHLLIAVFPHIQIELRRATLYNFSPDYNDIDLYQWFHGSKLCTIALETLITLSKYKSGAEYIEVKIRSPKETEAYTFNFFNKVMEIIDQAFVRVCSGIIIEKHILSSQELHVHSPSPYCYSPSEVFIATLEAESILDIALYNPNLDSFENITNLILFGDANLVNEIQWGCTLQVAELPAPVKLKICGLLDPPEPQGRDWCLLALRLGLNAEIIASLDSPHTSHAMRLLNMVECTIGDLVTNLHDLGRKDVAEVILRSTPLLRVVESVVN